MKKTIDFIVLALIFVFILCACSQSSEEIVPEYIVTSSGTDLDGFSATWGWTGTDGDTVFGFTTGTSNADMVIQRRKDIENTYNCKINVDYKEDILSVLRTGIMSGSQPLDIVKAGSFAMVEDVRAGYLTGLSAFLDIENIEKWGTPNMLQSLIWKNDIFGVTPFAWPDIPYTVTGHIIAVNESYVSKLSQTDPREFVENLTWTWDKFEECLSAYTHNDGGNTIYGMKSHHAYFAMNMFLSNGVALSAYEDGKVVCGAYTEPGRVALERAKKIMQETHHDCFHPTESAGDHTEFVNGECVMYVAWSSELINGTSSIMYQMDNVGILPFPQGPNATPGVYYSYHEDLPTSIGIPFNAKDPATSAIILSAMLEPFDEYKTKDDILDYMNEQIFFDRRDAEVLANVTRYTEYGFFREGARGVIESATEVTTAISALLESNKDKYDKIAEDYMTPHYQGRIAVYGE
jgi:ABC-type glycerol-3-phosphate transport system substrate-binding protein